MMPFWKKERLVATEIDRVQHVTMGPSAPVLALLEKYGTAPIKNGARLSRFAEASAVKL